MLKRFALFFTVSLMLWGCSSYTNSEITTRFHDDGRAKPTVAFLPVFDRSSADIGWSLSEEFTDQLRTRFNKRNNVFLSTSDALNPVVAKLGENDNPFTTETQWD